MRKPGLLSENSLDKFYSRVILNIDVKSRIFILKQTHGIR